MRDLTETRYGAKSWSGPRRVAARIEATRQGLDIRYVVTNIGGGTAGWLYQCLYCARGQAENLIKLHKTQLASDRTSCRSPLANQMRLLLHTAAYWLLLAIRAAIPKVHPLARAEFATIRLRLLKLAARISEIPAVSASPSPPHAQRRLCSAASPALFAATAIAIGASAPFTPNARNLQRLTHLPDQNAVYPATGRRVRYTILLSTRNISRHADE